MIFPPYMTKISWLQKSGNLSFVTIPEWKGNMTWTKKLPACIPLVSEYFCPTFCPGINSNKEHPQGQKKMKVYFSKVSFPKLYFFKLYFWKCLFQKRIFKNVFLENVFLKVYFWKCLFRKCICWKRQMINFPALYFVF